MASAEETNALRRKLGPAPDPLAMPGLTPARAYARAVLHAGAQSRALATELTGFSERMLSLSGIVGMLAEEGLSEEAPDTTADDEADEPKPAPLVLHLRRASGGQGLAIWDLDALSAVMEHMITGRILPEPPPPRRPTATDAAVLGEFQDRLFNLADAAMAEVNAPPPVTGYRCAGVMEGLRAIRLTLEDVEYREIRLDIRFGEAGRMGALRLVLPKVPASQVKLRRQEAMRWRNSWQRTVSRSTVQLDAVLHRVSLPMEDFMNLAPGMLLPLPLESLDQVAILGADGRTIARGRLGQMGGMRAIRLQEIPGTAASQGATPMEHGASFSHPISPEGAGAAHPAGAMADGAEALQAGIGAAGLAGQTGSADHGLAQGGGHDAMPPEAGSAPMPQGQGAPGATDEMLISGMPATENG